MDKKIPAKEVTETPFLQITVKEIAAPRLGIEVVIEVLWASFISLGKPFFPTFTFEASREEADVIITTIRSWRKGPPNQDLLGTTEIYRWGNVSF